MSISYIQVFITPLKTLITYGDQVEVTDYVLAGTIGKIKREIDGGQYDIGIFKYSDLSLKLANFDRRFNDENDSSSMFYFARDRAKVQVKYIDETGGSNIVFDGIINDEATRTDYDKQEVSFKVLSLDSIFNKVKVAGGLITDGVTASNAIKALLNRPSITGVLGYDASKISVGSDSVIDDATSFSDKSTRAVLALLLNASGSVFYVDSTGDMVVKNRDVLAASALELYGGGDNFGRDNVTDIKNYNTGLQRTFNTFTINDETETDENFVERYGLGVKSYSFDFITNTATAATLASYYVGQFKAPKIEMDVTVKTEVAKSVGILSPVSVSYPYQYIGFNGNKVPLAGASIAGQDIAPQIISGLQIPASKDWKVIGIEHDPKTFLTTLKLREV